MLLLLAYDMFGHYSTPSLDRSGALDPSPHGRQRLARARFGLDGDVLAST